MAVEAGARLQSLIALDDLWTSELDSRAGRGAMGRDEVDALTAIGVSMQQQLEFVPSQVGELAQMLREIDDGQIRGVLDAIVGSAGSDRGLAEALEALPPDLQGSIVSGCEYLGDRSGEEAQVLAQKLAVIEASGGVPPGDLRFPFRCAAMIALVGAGVAASIGLGGAPVLIGLAVTNQVGLGALGWTASGCPNALPQIHRR
ncbi:MAG: hypothetical protein JSR24_23610 [Proteobacteria bacterium]|nr:hypothetical protein [Pseudomonadota bacterium]